MLYSYNGQEPQPLPSRVYLEDGNTLTGVQNFSEDRLKSLGFRGPYAKPKYDEMNEKIIWNGIDYQIFPLNESERTLIQKLKGTYSYFWNEISKTSIYKKLREQSLNSLAANILSTEIISTFVDAKIGNPDIDKIQKHLNTIFLVLEITEEEKNQIENILTNSSLDKIYTIPSEEYISSHTYDFVSDSIKSF